MIKDQFPYVNYKFILKSLNVEHFEEKFIDTVKVLWLEFDKKNTWNNDLVFMWNGNEVDLIPDYNYEHFKDKEYSKDFFESKKNRAIERNLPNIPENKTNHALLKFWGIKSSLTYKEFTDDIDFDENLISLLHRNLYRNFSRGKIIMAYYRINDNKPIDSDEYKSHYLAIWHGKRMLAVICKREYVRDVYSQIFMLHMTRKELEDWRKLQWKKDEPSEKYTEEDNFRDGFDGDIDTWNHYNQ